MEENRDPFLTREIGRSMRFFLNLSCFFLVTFLVFLLYLPRRLTAESVMISLIPVIIAALFFLGFLRLLKNIESEAAKNRDIETTSRVIWEFNKSWIIRGLVGKIPAFKIEEKSE